VAAAMTADLDYDQDVYLRLQHGKLGFHNLVCT
jgi:hypothetical protein